MYRLQLETAKVVQPVKMKILWFTQQNTLNHSGVLTIHYSGELHFFFYSWNTGFPSCTWHGSLHYKIPLYWIFHAVGGSDVLADMKSCKGMGMLCCVVHLLWFILFLFQGVWWGHSFLYLSGQESTNSRDNMTFSRNLPLVITCSAVYYGKLNNTKI